MPKDIQAWIVYKQRMYQKQEDKAKKIANKEKAAARRARQRALDEGLAYIPTGKGVDMIVYLEPPVIL